MKRRSGLLEADEQMAIGQVHDLSVYHDFQNSDAKGRLRLNIAGTIADLERNHIQLHDGLVLALYSDDDGPGRDELRALGTVAFSTEENVWVASIDWDALHHASDEAVSQTQSRRSAAG
jgi:hypothetical protein